MKESELIFAEKYAERACPFDLSSQCVGPACWAFDVEIGDGSEGTHFFSEEEREKYMEDNPGFTYVTQNVEPNKIWTSRMRPAKWLPWLFKERWVDGWEPNPNAGKTKFWAWRDQKYARCKRLEAA